MARSNFGQSTSHRNRPLFRGRKQYWKGKLGVLSYIGEYVLVLAMNRAVKLFDAGKEGYS